MRHEPPEQTKVASLQSFEQRFDPLLASRGRPLIEGVSPFAFGAINQLFFVQQLLQTLF